MFVMDGRVRRRVEVPAVRRGLLRLRIHLPCADGGVRATDVRALLVGDMLLRAVEVDGGQVVHDCVHPPEAARELKGVMSALGIHPPSGLTGDADVHVFGGTRRDGEQGVWIEVGQVRDMTVTAIAGDRLDPLAIRLALLSHPYGRPVTFTPHDLTDADRVLRLWRSHVAQWARMPSRPIPEVFRRLTADALADDLDTPALLDVLRRVEGSPKMPAGARFETAAHVDRVLGLELTREVGRT